MRTMTTRPSRRRSAQWAFLAAAGLIAVSACGGDDDDGDDGDESPPAATQQQGADGNGGAEDDTGTTAGTLDQLIANSDSHDEVTTSSGGRVVVGVDCEFQTGGTIISVGSAGVPEGIYKGDFEPAAGGSLTLQVLADGQGLGARQTTLDEASYTITFADLDGGVELTVSGCAT